MEINNQTQKGGDNSTQIQAGTINYIYQGITEEKAKEICRYECQKALQQWAQNAHDTANERISKLEEKVLPKMVKYDKELRIFSDPSFQILLRKAQISAACSERDEDYEMLSDLLLHRAEQSDNRSRKLGIEKAIEVVDKVDEVALIALSLVYAIDKFIPISLNVDEGINALANLYTKIIGCKSLPDGTEWMEHLDLLSAIRMNSTGIGSFNKMENFVPQKLHNYFVCGIENSSVQYEQIVERFKKCGLSMSCFTPYPLKSGFLQLNIPTNNIDELSITRTTTQGLSIQIPLTTEQKDCISFAIQMAAKEDLNDENMKLEFWKIWNKHPILSRIKDWWNKLPVLFTITPMGKALANAYIKGKDPTVPSLY